MHFIFSGGRSGDVVRAGLLVLMLTFAHTSGMVADSTRIKENANSVDVRYEEQPVFGWRLLAENILPQWRDGIATVVRGDDIYIIGGWNPRTFPAPFTATTNEIWKSSDGGMSWELVGKAGFTPRHTFVCIESENGYVYVIGGDQYNNDAERAEVWRSKNMLDWELVADNSPFGGRMLMAGVEYKGNFYVGGGQDLPDFKKGLTDIFVSKDKGITWKLLTDTLTHMGKNVVGTMCVFNNRIYQVSGGWYGGDSLSAFTYKQEVYSTADGVHWRTENPIPIPGAQYPNTVVFDNKLWCVAGSSVVSGSVTDHYNKNDLCYMGRDGEWHALTRTVNGPKTHASSLIVYKHSMLMVVGNQLNSVYELSKRTDSLR